MKLGPYRLTLLLTFTLFLNACGTTEHNGSGNEPEPVLNQHKDKVEKSGSESIVAGSLDPSLQVKEISANIVHLIYQVKNQTEQVQTVTFPTSQRFDYILTTNDGALVQRFSQGKMFAQVIKEVTLKQGETLSYDIQLDKLSHGSYKIKVWLAVKDGKEHFSETISFEVGE